MAITILNNTASVMTQRQLGTTTRALDTVFERLSSGLRINRASDDAAGLAIADSLRADTRVLHQGIRNVNDGLSLLNVADAALENLSNIASRLEELATQAANGTYGNKQRSALNSEAQALSAEFTRITQTTTFNGLRLFTGELQQVRVQAGAGANGTIVDGIGGAIGSGGFGSENALPTSGQLTGIETADLNGDGFLDIVGSDFFHQVRVTLGNGDGTFRAGVLYPAGNTVYDLDIADFNGDGIMDIASAGVTSRTVGILIGNGDGTFQSVITYDTVFQANTVAHGDVNGDGILDIVASSGTQALVLLGSGSGSFSPKVSFQFQGSNQELQIADFNGDGKADIAGIGTFGPNSRIALVLGNGDGSFNTAVTINIEQGQDGEFADFNGDGILDVASASTSGVIISTASGQGTFNAGVTYAMSGGAGSVVTGDINGDGKADILAYRTDGTLQTLLGNGNGTFAAGYSFSTSQLAYTATLGDFNGDGVLDFYSNDNGGDIFRLGSKIEGVGAILPFSLSTQAEARGALPVIQRKRQALAIQRGEIGAFQARLSTATNVLSITGENYTTAESRIRDVDVAEEASRLVKLKILQQAAGAVLAQANQQPALAKSLLTAENRK